MYICDPLHPGDENGEKAPPEHMVTQSSAASKSREGEISTVNTTAFSVYNIHVCVGSMKISVAN